MATAGARLLLGVAVLLAGAACTADDAPDPDAAATTTASTATTGSPSTAVGEPLPDDAVWVLGDPDLTFVRVDAHQVPLGGDSFAPIVEGTRLLLQYRTPAGGAVYVEQGELADADLAIEDLVPPAGASSASFSLAGGRPVALTPGGGGAPPTLATIAGSSRVTISAPEDELRPLASTLEPISRADLDGMVHEVSDGVIERGEAEPVVDGITFHREPGADPLACLDGQEPDGCATADRYGPLVMAPIPQDGTYVVVGCISQPIPITQVVVDEQPVPTRTAPCGQAFSVPDRAPGTLAITFDDGPGGVGTYTFDLPAA